MDEYNSGMDPDVKEYFRKIVKTYSLGLFYLLVIAVAGLFFKLGYWRGSPQWYHVAFYVFFLVTFALLLRYFGRVWRRKN